MAMELPGEFTAATLFTRVNRQGVVFLWPVKLPGPDGKHNEWHRSAAEAAELGMDKWVRITANMSLGAYEVFEATGDLPEPTWPDLPFEEILKIAFRDHIVGKRRSPVGAAPAWGKLTVSVALARPSLVIPEGAPIAGLSWRVRRRTSYFPSKRSG
jgi:hypothetical protein